LVLAVEVIRFRGQLGYAISCRPFFVLLSSLKKKRLGVGAVENCLQFSKSLVDAFFASTGTSASMPSSLARKVSVSVEATENSRDDTRARTWVDLEVGRDPDRRSWGILTSCFSHRLAQFSGCRSSLAQIRRNRSRLIDRRTDRTNRRSAGAAGARRRRCTRTALASPHRHC
jgi:hypothetical protein